ncbi:TPR domain-containing protein [Croceitalea dokdonensis DOKDO 023]|uniref:TPR domain-containing protein n=2 Tax=Croceitalea TaxID=574891 RepID=A0A0P7AX92_9FLAO|nr:TPR domain-containing protein [Croceitalea dokdonensis DOKDO 023]
MTNLSIFAEHAKVKNYDAAYEPWKMVWNTCPDLNKATFSYGERILKHKIKNSSGADKDGHEQDLMKLYDDSHKYFPAKFSKVDVLTDKANYKSDNNLASDEQLYDMIKPLFDSDLKSFKNPKVLYIYFSSLVNLHNAGKKDLQEVFDVYDDVTEQNEVINKSYTDRINTYLQKEEAGTLTSKDKRNLGVYTRNSELLGKVSGSIDAKLGQLADCENLIPLYNKSFDSKKNDVQWVKKAVSRMFSKECTDDPLFSKMVEVQAELDPSADVYVYLGTLKSKANDKNGAIADFNKAVELETDNFKKSRILYRIATIVRRSSKSQARNYAQKAIDANPSNGRAYLLIANLYAGSANDCGSTVFEKRAIYWKAAEMARRAGRVDPSLKGRANQTAASYEAKAPDKTMIFNADMSGKTVTFSCWVGGSVKVPNL